MKIEFECFIAGTRFVHGFTLHYATPTEASCLRHLIALWAEDPRIGGKGASGYGRLRLAYDEAVLPSADLYRTFVGHNRAEILSVLDRLQAAVH
jgi:CRISPR/Cas system CSM-associated protein Csm3 (group 7 of RAMP superfamily)